MRDIPIAMYKSPTTNIAARREPITNSDSSTGNYPFFGVSASSSDISYFFPDGQQYLWWGFYTWQSGCLSLDPSKMDLLNAGSTIRLLRPASSFLVEPFLL